MPHKANKTANRLGTGTSDVTFRYLTFCPLMLLYNLSIGCGKYRAGNNLLALAANCQLPMALFSVRCRSCSTGNHVENQKQAPQNPSYNMSCGYRAGWSLFRLRTPGYPFTRKIGARMGTLGLRGWKRGKSELHRAMCRITSGKVASRPLDGKCHREHTATGKRTAKAARNPR